MRHQQYTRMFAVSFNLYNGNDFDSDDYDPAAKSWVSATFLIFPDLSLLASIGPLPWTHCLSVKHGA